MGKKISRILITATSSGGGKTLITCGILQALKKRGLRVNSYKCGPDYIDPMFHKQVIGTNCGNLDAYFMDEEKLKWLLTMREDADISVMEGVMGYFDGIGGTDTWASAYDVAVKTKTPSILLINGSGMSLSIIPLIKGFLAYEKEPRIKGVILNQVSPMLYKRLKAIIEKETGVKVLGYVPKLTDCILESRHLGLVMPHEIHEIKEKLERLGKILEETLELDELINLAKTATEIETTFKVNPLMYNIRIGLAEDEAFCFTYEDNRRMLESYGVELVLFSPIRDDKLPKNIDGLLLNGGYPELFAKELSQNYKMRQSVKRAIADGLPCIAECGGFMYLQQQLKGQDGEIYDMVGAIKGSCENKGKLSRFGYIGLTCDEVFGQEMPSLVAHEFHYYDSTDCGEHFTGKKPLSNRGWSCGIHVENLLAGFPHFYYYGNETLVEAFLKKCEEYKTKKDKL